MCSKDLGVGGGKGKKEIVRFTHNFVNVLQGDSQSKVEQINKINQDWWYSIKGLIRSQVHDAGVVALSLKSIILVN